MASQQHDPRDEQIRRDIEKAHRDFEHAVEVTLEDYRCFVIPYPTSKKYKLQGKPDKWATLHPPFMTAEGVIKGFVDAHNTEDQIYTIIYDAHIENITADIWVVRATVTSQLFGSSTDFAQISTGEKKAIEGATTIATRRAIKKFGYGIFDGVASADAGEESPDEAPVVSQPREAPAMYEAPRDEPDDIPEPMTARQKAFLRDLLETAGHSKEDTERILMGIKTSAQARDMISEIRKTAEDDIPEPSANNEMASTSQWKFARSLLSQCGTHEGDSEALLIRVHGEDISKRDMSGIIETLQGVVKGEGENKLHDPYLREYIKMLCKDDRGAMENAASYIRDKLKVTRAADLTAEQQKELFAL